MNNKKTSENGSVFDNNDYPKLACFPPERRAAIMAKITQLALDSIKYMDEQKREEEKIIKRQEREMNRIEKEPKKLEKKRKRDSDEEEKTQKPLSKRAREKILKHKLFTYPSSD